MSEDGIMMVLCLGIFIGVCFGRGCVRSEYQTQACERNYATRTISNSGKTKWYWNCDIPTNTINVSTNTHPLFR